MENTDSSSNQDLKPQKRNFYTKLRHKPVWLFPVLDEKKKDEPVDGFFQTIIKAANLFQSQGI